MFENQQYEERARRARESQYFNQGIARANGLAGGSASVEEPTVGEQIDGQLSFLKEQAAELKKEIDSLEGTRAAMKDVGLDKLRISDLRRALGW